MPTPTYDLIASNVLGSSAASVTFSSIPATYRDLVLVVNAENAGNSLAMRLNSDTGSNYSRVLMSGDGSVTSSFAGTNTRFFFGPIMTPALYVIQLMDYSAIDKHKSLLARGNNAGSGVEASAHRWANTSAITTILLEPSNVANQFFAGSSFHLYGIAS